MIGQLIWTATIVCNWIRTKHDVLLSCSRGEDSSRHAINKEKRHFIHSTNRASTRQFFLWTGLKVLREMDKFYSLLNTILGYLSLS